MQDLSRRRSFPTRSSREGCAIQDRHDGMRVVTSLTGDDAHMKRFALFVFVLGLFVSAPAAAQGGAQASQGEKVFAEKKCSVCHLVGDVGNKKGPSLDGVGSKLKAEEIRQWITNAPEMAAKADIIRKPPMKAYTDFSKEEVDALVAYVASLKK
jgi:mono/diheme cytochrome c family protein